jgi:hypothetical protein
MLLKDLHTTIAVKNGKYDLDPFTETSCSEHREKGCLKLVAPRQFQRWKLFSINHHWYILP